MSAIDITNAKNRIGMYNETPRVVVGDYSICRQDPDGENKTVWIEDILTGEGADRNISAFTAKEVGMVTKQSKKVFKLAEKT